MPLQLEPAVIRGGESAKCTDKIFQIIRVHLWRQKKLSIFYLIEIVYLADIFLWFFYKQNYNCSQNNLNDLNKIRMQHAPNSNHNAKHTMLDKYFIWWEKVY